MLASAAFSSQMIWASTIIFLLMLATGATSELTPVEIDELHRVYQAEITNKTYNKNWCSFRGLEDSTTELIRTVDRQMFYLPFPTSSSVVRFVDSILDPKLDTTPIESGGRELEIMRNNAEFLLAVNGDGCAIDYLINQGLDINKVDFYNRSVVFMALFDMNPRRGLEKVKALIKNGADFKVKNIASEGVLHQSASSNDEKGVEYFLKLGLDPNEKDSYGKTALHYAMENVHGKGVKIAYVLLNYGARCDIKNAEGKTPLDEAGKLRSKIEDLCEMKNAIDLLLQISV